MPPKYRRPSVTAGPRRVAERCWSRAQRVDAGFVGESAAGGNRPTRPSTGPFRGPRVYRPPPRKIVDGARIIALEQPVERCVAKRPPRRGPRGARARRSALVESAHGETRRAASVGHDQQREQAEQACVQRRLGEAGFVAIDHAGRRRAEDREQAASAAATAARRGSSARR